MFNRKKDEKKKVHMAETPRPPQPKGKLTEDEVKEMLSELAEARGHYYKVSPDLIAARERQLQAFCDEHQITKSDAYRKGMALLWGKEKNS